MTSRLATHAAGAGPRAVLAAAASRSSAEAAGRVQRLFRQSLRCIPFVVDKYQLDLTHQEVASAVRQMFRRHTGVTDLGAIDMLVFRGKQELEEVLEVYKTRSHITNMLQQHGDNTAYEEERHWGESHSRPGDTPFLRRFFKDGPYELD